MNFKALANESVGNVQNEQDRDAPKSAIDTPTIEELMRESEPDNRFNSDDDCQTARLHQIEGDDPTEELLAPELIFPPGSKDETEEDS